MATNYRRMEEASRMIEKAMRQMDSYIEPTHNKSFVLRSNVRELKQLRIAAISDTFTNDSFSPECQWVQILPECWLEQMDALQPDLFFLESAWQGKDGKWQGQVNYPSPTLITLLSYCHRHHIPVIFRNKEDPVYTDRFMSAARLCDYVFTTDVDCIPKYRAALGHDRVYYLHFAAQPKHYNPIETEERQRRISFAGSYYPHYPQRNKNLWDLIQAVKDDIGIDIYDRNYYVDNTPNKFPSEWAPYIVGNLPYDQIKHAYIGYRYSVNMNSVTQSNSMFARRVFELMLSNTIVLSNYSRGLDQVFGELVVCTDNGLQMAKQIQELEKNDNYRKLRLRALRCVLERHLYADRLDEICSIVFGVHLKPSLPEVTVFCQDGTHPDVDRQQNVILHAVPFGTRLPENQNAFVTVFDCNCRYGEYYLEDLLLSTRYSDYAGYGKPLDQEHAYHETDTLLLRSGIVQAKMLREQGIEPAPDTQLNGCFLAVDEFHFAQDSEPESIEPDHSFTGLTQIAPTDTLFQRNMLCTYSGGQIAEKIRDPQGQNYQAFTLGNKLHIVSQLSATGSLYLITDIYITRKDWNSARCLAISYNKSGDLNATICGWYITSGISARRGSVEFLPDQENQISIPDYADKIRFVLRLEGPGTAVIDSLQIDAMTSFAENTITCRSSTAIVTNIYPSYDDLYRNMFVHTRVLLYRQAGCDFDVIRCERKRAGNLYYDFEGIPVVATNATGLEAVANQVDTICVHFLFDYMWEALKKHLGKIRLIIWCHGSDIQPWWRREYNYASDQELEEAKKQSNARMELWREVFETAKHADIHFVFVSEYFAREVMEDYQVSLPKGQYSVIHNVTDVEQFDYTPKNASQRLKLLSVRPYTSQKYANDLTVQMIQLLRDKPFFNELEFRLIGKGILFHDTLAPIMELPNVLIEETFLTHDQIANLQKEYGIFITPTRWDSQGVSRDEAMSSGLVPITNAVTAIPEFCDETCAILAPGEDAQAMADGVEMLYQNPEVFLQMSENAAKRVRSQTAYEQTIQKEIDLIWPIKKRRSIYND